MARLNRSSVAVALLALLTLAMTAWLWRWASLNHSWGNDEELYRHFAQGMSNDFSLFFHMDPSYGRGIQRLHLLLMAIPLALFKNPAAFDLAHLVFVGVYASSAIPAWLMARGSGVGSLPALIPAVLVVLTPWAVVTTSFLSEPIAYGAFAWAVWATWRAALRPSLVADGVAVVLMALAVLAHTGFLLLVPVLPVVAVLQAWRFGTGEGARWARLKRLPLAALRRQPLAVGLGLLGALLLALLWAGILPGGPGRFTGSYGTNLPPLWLMASKWRSFLSRVDAGTGFLLLAAALPWIIARIIQPRDPAAHALAWTSLLASCAVLLGLVGGAGDERYVMYMGFTIPVTACVALLRRELNALMALLGGAAAFVLFFTPGWHLVDPTDFGYFGFPTESFMARVVLTKLHNALSSVDPRTSGGVLLALGLLTMVVLAARPRTRRWLPVVLVPAIVFQLAATGYAINKHVNTVGAHHGPSLRARSFVDAHVGGGDDVGVYAVSNGLTGAYNVVWREVQYWNTRVRQIVKVNSPATYFPSADVPYPFGTLDTTAQMNQRTGRVTWNGKWKFPKYLVIPQPPIAGILSWKRIAQASYIPATLVKPTLPLQMRATLSGAAPDGHMNGHDPAVVTVYAAGRPRARCVFVDMLTPQARVPKPGLGLRYTIAKGKRVVTHGRVEAGKLVRAYVPVTFGGKPSMQFTVESPGTIKADAGPLGLQIANYDLLTTRCPAPKP